MIYLPLTKQAGVIGAVSKAITHPIGQAAMASAPIVAATIPMMATPKKEEEKKVAVLPLAGLAAGAMSALARPGVQAAMTLAPVALSMGRSAPSTPSPSPAQSRNMASPSGAFAPTTSKQSAVATTPDGVIDNSQVMTPTPGHSGISGTGSNSSTASATTRAKQRATTSAGARHAFKMAWYLPFQNPIKDFAVGAYNAADDAAGKLMQTTDTLDPIKTRVPVVPSTI